MSALNSARSPSSRANDVIHLAKDIATLRLLENTKIGQVQYDNGWDTKPHSFFRLVSEVQQQSDLQKSLVLERAWQITVKNKSSIGGSSKDSPPESIGESSCSSSTVNEFYNNEYYESGSSSPSHTPLPARSPRNSKRVNFVDSVDSIICKTPRARPEDEKNLRDLLSVTGNKLPGLSPEMCKPLVGHILKRGLGCREEEYADADLLMGFLQNSLVYDSTKEALAAYEDKYNEEFQARLVQRARMLEEGRAQSTQLTPEQVAERKRNSEIRQLRDEQKILRSIEDGKKQIESFNTKQRLERERLKKAQEAEKKILEDVKRKEEEAAAAKSAAIKAEQERLEVERKLKEAEDEKRKQGELASKIAEEQKKKDAAAAASAAAAIPKPAEPGAKGYEVPPEFQGYILPPDLQRYLRSQKLLADNTEKYANISVKTTKDYYSAALKAVNTTLNSIAPEPAHIQSKVNQLADLLQGKSVYLGESSGINFSSSSQPNGELFISSLLAYRYVKKSESEISKGRTSVEPLATLGVSMVKQFPHWGILVRANFYKMCPFLVPFSFPRNNMSVEEYAFAMGHELKGSESAVRQALLDKITGYCTLYALMVRIFERQKVTNIIGESSQFFSMAEVWRILVASMRLRPQLDMTATVIQILLENLGDRLSALYGHQFKKLIQFLLTTYLPEIRKETPAGKMAALTRLEIFLESKLQKGF